MRLRFQRRAEPPPQGEEEEGQGRGQGQVLAPESEQGEQDEQGPEGQQHSPQVQQVQHPEEQRLQSPSCSAVWIESLPPRLEISGLLRHGREANGRFALSHVDERGVDDHPRAVYECEAGRGIVLSYREGAWSVHPPGAQEHAFIYGEGEGLSPTELGWADWYASDGHKWVTVPSAFAVRSLPSVAGDRTTEADAAHPGRRRRRRRQQRQRTAVGRGRRRHRGERPPRRGEGAPHAHLRGGQEAAVGSSPPPLRGRVRSQGAAAPRAAVGVAGLLWPPLDDHSGADEAYVDAMAADEERERHESALRVRRLRPQRPGMSLGAAGRRSLSPRRSRSRTAAAAPRVPRGYGQRSEGRAGRSVSVDSIFAAAGRDYYSEVVTSSRRSPGPRAPAGWQARPAAAAVSLGGGQRFRSHPAAQPLDDDLVWGSPSPPRGADVDGTGRRSERHERLRHSRRPRTTFRGLPKHRSQRRDDSPDRSPGVRRPAGGPEEPPKRDPHDLDTRARKDADTNDMGCDDSADAATLVAALEKRWAGASILGSAAEEGGSEGRCWVERWDNAAASSRDMDGEALVTQLAQVLRRREGQQQRGSSGRSSAALFEDRSFPCTAASLHPLGAEAAAAWLDMPDLSGVQWKRPAELYGGQSTHATIKAFDGDIDPEDVEQTLPSVDEQGRAHRPEGGEVSARAAAQLAVDGSYFRAALAAIAGQGVDGAASEDVLTRDLLVEDGADVGLFGIKWWVGGSWRTLLLDDRLPCVRSPSQEAAGGISEYWEPLFLGRAAGRQLELWPLLFEKAWAKMHGSWAAIGGGWAGDTLNYLTAGACTTLDLYDEDAAEAGAAQPAHHDEWQALHTALGSGAGLDFRPFCTCALTVDAAANQSSALHGLRPGQTYSVMHAVEVPRAQLGGLGETAPASSAEEEMEQFVCLRGAPGAEWRGAYGLGSAEQSRHGAALMDRAAGSGSGSRAARVAMEGQGIFWMRWQDYKTHFWEAILCDPWSQSAITGGAEAAPHAMAAEVACAVGHWKQGRSAGGAAQASGTFRHNPSWELLLQPPTGRSGTAPTTAKVKVQVAMYQEDIRGRALVDEDGELDADGIPLGFQPMSLYVLLPGEETPQELVALDVNRRQASATLELTLPARPELGPLRTPRHSSREDEPRPRG